MYEMAGSFHKCKHSNRVVDSDGTEVQMFDDVPEILKVLHTSEEFSETEVAVASSTTYPQWARSCMKLLNIDELECNLETIINYKQAIYPRNKKVHFRELTKVSGVDYEDMLFFDNESYNIREVSELGVTCIHCSEGRTWEHFERGLDSHNQMKLCNS